MNNTKAKDLNKLFRSKGFNPVLGNIYQQQEYWINWYRGKVDGFHNTVMKNAEGVSISIEKPSLQMAKKVSEDVSSLLFNEKVQLLVNDETAQAVLDKVLLDNNFTDEMSNFVELTCVYGTGVIVEYKAEGETKLNFLFGDKLIVIDYDNTTIKEIAVIQEFVYDKNKYNHIMYHTFREGLYRITHEMYATSESNKGIGNPAPLAVLFNEAELNKMKHTRKDGEEEIVEYYIEYETEKPHFQAFKLGISNNWDLQSPMGIAVFANKTGTLENIDEKYYSSRMDSINSRKRLFIDDEASKLHKTKDENGNIVHKKYFDPAETQFQVLKDMTSQGNKAIEVYAPAYDSLQHDQAIQAELNYLSDGCMLGGNYYSYKDGVVGYQNELSLALSNAPMRRNRNKNLNKLKRVLVDMMKAILFLEEDNGNYSGSLDLEYEVQFDDDIFTDDKTKLDQLRLDAQDGYVPEYMYVMKAYGLTMEEAKAMLLEAENENGFIEPESVTPPQGEDNENEDEEEVDGEE